MTIWLAVFLGLVQGLTEFLPVSSSGHLILFQRMFGLDGDMMLFNIVLHVATLLAVLFVFRKKIWELLKNPFQRTNYVLVLATVITVGFVLLFHGWIERTFSANVLPVTFLITAIVLFSTSFIKNNKNQMTYGGGAFVGLIQGLAVIPGFSRSGFTIAAGMAVGTKREVAAEFSFLMSIPIILAALVFELVSGGGIASVGMSWWYIVAAFIVALLSGVFAIKFMMQIIRTIGLWWFSIYLIIVAMISLFII